MWAALGKYRAVVVSIALFVILDASVLGLNFYISYKIADDAVGVNVAGRQRMLSQRMVKSLYQLEDATTTEDYATARNELGKAVQLFERSLNGFEFGGTVEGADGTNVILNPVTSADGQKTLREARSLWDPYAASLSAVILAEDGAATNLDIIKALSLATQTNLPLLKLMNNLTVHLEHVATSQVQTLRTVQTVGISLAILNFFIIVFHFIGQLRNSDKRLDEAREETTQILNTVNEGLFLIDKDLKIGTQRSARLSDMFGGKPLENITMTDLIKDLVKPKTLQTAERFVALLFRPTVKDSLIRDLNPLNEVEINIQEENGGYTTRFLRFDFSRVRKQKFVLVTVNDITQSVTLTKELAHEREKSEQQLETLTSILHAEPRMLKRFLQNAMDTYAKINGILKNQSKSDLDMSKKLDEIFIEVHNFKGEASSMALENFADLAHLFENDVHTLKNKTTPLTGNDFLTLTVHLEKIISYTESVSEIARKLADFSIIAKESDPKTPSPPAKNLKWQHLFTLCEAVAEREKKDVQLVLSGLAENTVDDSQLSLFNDICIQFIRNAIVHSIERPETRLRKGKARVARIDIRLSRMADGALELSVQDDGQGLDYEKIRQKAEQTGQWAGQQIRSWSNKQLLSIIFEPGFSTAEALTEDAGRGVGMDVIRSRVKSVDGRIKISNRFGQSCQFTITLPDPKTAELAA